MVLLSTCGVGEGAVGWLVGWGNSSKQSEQGWNLKRKFTLSFNPSTFNIEEKCIHLDGITWQ